MGSLYRWIPGQTCSSPSTSRRKRLQLSGSRRNARSSSLNLTRVEFVMEPAIKKSYPRPEDFRWRTHDRHSQGLVRESQTLFARRMATRSRFSSAHSARASQPWAGAPGRSVCPMNPGASSESNEHNPSHVTNVIWDLRCR